MPKQLWLGKAKVAIATVVVYLLLSLLLGQEAQSLLNLIALVFLFVIVIQLFRDWWAHNHLNDDKED